MKGKNTSVHTPGNALGAMNKSGATAQNPVATTA